MGYTPIMPSTPDKPNPYEPPQSIEPVSGQQKEKMSLNSFLLALLWLIPSALLAATLVTGFVLYLLFS